MAISLAKGQKISLEKSSDAGLSRVIMGLGWDAKKVKTGGFLGMFAKETTQSIDLDASCVMFDAAGAQTDTVWFRQLASKCGSVSHTGDNRTGDGDGDDEAIEVDLSKVPAEVARVAIAVTIHDAEPRRLNFGMVSNAYVRIVNQATNQEIARYDLAEDASTETALIFAEVYRHNNDWKFKAVGQGYKGGLGPLARNYGVNV
jgi:tellurium resistance protein TerD